MKLIITIITSLGILSSCGSNHEIEKLNTEVINLIIENVDLQNKLDEYENAIVIKYEDIHKYINTVSFGGYEFDKNEKASFTTQLVLNKLPSNIKFQWKSEPESMLVENDGLTHYLTNTYTSSGDKLFEGEYELIFPNGQTKTMKWERDFKVK